MFLNLLKNNSEALELLDWFQITSDISSLSHFDVTKKNLLDPPNFHDAVFILNKLEQLSFTINTYDELAYSFNTHIRLIPTEEEKFQSLPYLYKERFFDASELNFFALLFSGFKDSRQQFFKIPNTEEFVLSDKTIDSIRRDFLSPLREFVDASGRISYERHPILKNLYAKLLQTEQDLRNQVLKISQSENYRLPQ